MAGNKLSQFAAPSPNAGFRMPKFPKLSDHVDAHGFKEGIKKFDAELSEAVAQTERLLNEALSQSATKIPKSGA